MKLELEYEPRVDAVAIRTRGPIAPGGIDDTERLDADRLVSFDADGEIVKYQFLNASRHGVRIDDLEHREELAVLFAEAGFRLREWGDPIPTRTRDRAAG